MRQNAALDSKEYQDFDAVHASGVLTVRAGVGAPKVGLQGGRIPFLAQRSVLSRQEDPHARQNPDDSFYTMARLELLLRSAPTDEPLSSHRVRKRLQA